MIEDVGEELVAEAVFPVIRDPADEIFNVILEDGSGNILTEDGSYILTE